MQPHSSHSFMPLVNDAGPSFPPGVPILSGSAFSHAHSFTMNNPLLSERININYTQNLPSDYQALSWLCAHTIRGVEFSSAARDPPPRCHPGTREKLNFELQEWLDQARKSPRRVACLCGAAGVGKSAIAQSVAEHAITDRKLLGVTVFFDQLTRGPQFSSTHNEPSKLWLTVAYRLATKHPAYLRYIQQAVALDPKLVEQSMEHQFRSLITEPIGILGLLNDSSDIIPIFLDGLDQFYGPRTQEQIMHLILIFARTFPDAPLAWMISFRPEGYLLKLVSEYTNSESQLIRRIPVLMDSAEAKKDVRLFMRSKFSQMQQRYDIVEPMPWPVEEEFIRLHTSASGLFIFASAIISFCEDRDVADPASQLDAMLPLISNDPNPPRVHLERHPLKAVHAMYQRILEDVPRGSTLATRRILGFLLLPNGYGAWTPRSTSFWALCNILGISQHAAYACLSRLTAVLDIPTPQDAIHTPISFLHISFAHYLLDKEVSKEFCIDVKSVVADLWQCHFRALQQANDTISTCWLPEPSQIRLSWSIRSRREEVEFRIDFWENARRMFFHHLLPCPSSSCPSAPHNHLLEDLGSSRALSIYFDKLVEGYAFPDLPYGLIAFLDWLFQSPQRYIFQEPISRQPVLLSPGCDIWVGPGLCFKIQVERFDDGGCITTFKSYAPQRLNLSRDIDSSRFFSTREPSESIAVLQEELSGRENLASVTLGRRCHILVDTPSPGLKLYYILSPALGPPRFDVDTT